MSIRSRFDKELELLDEDLVKMGSMIEESINKSLKALETNDTELAKEIIETDKNINKMEAEIESRALKLLLRQQPVASDLRLISTAMKMITDMERIGDHAADIASIAIDQKKRECQVSAVIDNSIKEMATIAIEMVASSISAFIHDNKELADKVIDRDDDIDKLFLKERDIIIDKLKKDEMQPNLAIDVMMLIKYLERIGDHATNLAEWVIFYLTGKHKNNRLL